MAHIAPPLPPDEAERLAELEDLSVLDTEPEKVAEPDRMLEVQDAETDPRFVTNLFGPDLPPVRFYAGYPLQ